MEQTVRIHTIHPYTSKRLVACIQHPSIKNSIIAKFRLHDLKPTPVEGPLTFFKRLNLSGRKGDPDARDFLAGLDAFLGLGCEGGHSYVFNSPQIGENNYFKKSAPFHPPPTPSGTTPQIETLPFFFRGDITENNRRGRGLWAVVGQAKFWKAGFGCFWLFDVFGGLLEHPGHGDIFFSTLEIACNA